MSDSWATISKDGKYRYLLGRRVSDSPSRLLFIMLNPSTADATRNDPTIRRCMGFAQQWGFGLLQVANLFAYRTASPAELRSASDPVGADNQATLHSAMQDACLTVLAWGNHGAYMNRSAAVVDLALSATLPHHLGMTMKGQPKHPLYLPKTTTPTAWGK